MCETASTTDLSLVAGWYSKLTVGMEVYDGWMTRKQLFESRGSITPGKTVMRETTWYLGYGVILCNQQILFPNIVNALYVTLQHFSFKEWAVVSGKIHENPNDKAKWKTNFRCALSSLKNQFKQLEDFSKESVDPHKIYQLIVQPDYRSKSVSISDQRYPLKHCCNLQVCCHMH